MQDARLPRRRPRARDPGLAPTDITPTDTAPVVPACLASVATHRAFTLPLQGLATGLYLLRVEADGLVWNRRFVKE